MYTGKSCYLSGVISGRLLIYDGVINGDCSTINKDYTYLNILMPNKLEPYIPKKSISIKSYLNLLYC